MSLQVTVSILDREYVVGCTEEERAGLIAAAAYLDGKMREIRNASRTASVDRIAVLAALNIAHEMLSQQHSSQKQAATMLDALGTLRARIDATLIELLHYKSFTAKQTGAKFTLKFNSYGYTFSRT